LNERPGESKLSRRCLQKLLSNLTLTAFSFL
jgi:hypothetical protein